MKKTLIATALVVAGSLCLQDISIGHGGTYRGPGDTVPPGGGGSGGAPGAPGAGGTTTPGPAGPSTPGPAGPGTPTGGSAGPITGVSGTSGGPDLTLWQYWWGFNREPYLNLKSHVRSGSITTGSEEFYLGKGEQGDARDALRPSEADVRTKVVPALIKALRNENANDIISGCLVALAKIGDAKTEGGEAKSAMADEIKRHLSSSSQEIQETAAVALGILANEANIPLLKAMLYDDGAALKDAGVTLNGSVPERTRAFAAYGLGLIGYRGSDAGRLQIVEALTKFLDGPGGSTAQRDVPVACITALGLTPLPIDASSAPVDVSKTIARPATVTNRQAQLLWLLSFFEDQEVPFLSRAHAPTALGRLTTDMDGNWLRGAVAEKLLASIDKLAKPQNEIKQSCLVALGLMGDCDGDKADVDIRAGLMKAIENLPDEQSTNFAMIALAQVSGRPGKGEGSPIFGLEQKKDSPRAFLLEKLAKSKAATKAWAALSVAVLERSLEDSKQLSSSEAKGMLQSALEEAKAPEEVGALAISVGIAKDAAAKEILREKFQKITEPESRGFAAIGLGLMDDRDSIAMITDVLKKAKYQPELLKSAAIGLGLLGDKEIVPDLITMLKEATSLSSQAAITNGLGFIGDARSIVPLIELLEDKQKTDRARGFAAVALGIVADKEDLPWNAKISVNINYRANTPTLTAPAEGTGILDIL